MRIAVHDYGGYPFIVQLSRELANLGHEVAHFYAEGFRHPRDPMERRPGDPELLRLTPVTLQEELRRGGIRRISQERRYGRSLAEELRAFRPSVVLSANAPLDVQAAAASRTHAVGGAFVPWLQDLHSIAITRLMGRRSRLVGGLIGARFGMLERRLLRKADGIVAISSAFLPTIQAWGISPTSVSVIENWAPLDAPQWDQDNPWSEEHGLAGCKVVLYAGTLALKHDPGLLLALAHRMPDVAVVVVSEGPGADWLISHAADAPNLRVMPLQPYERLPEVLASADVLVAVLEPDASSFSVPSKVLTYLAAGRAILAALPHDNPAAALIEKTGAGQVVDPRQADAFVAAAGELLTDPERRRAAGAAGRRHANEAFAIGPIARQFEEVLIDATVKRSRRRGRGGSVAGERPDR